MYQNIRFFPNLIPLRFVAAYLVVLFHIEETRKMFHLPDLTQFSLFTHGPLAVTFFFVLSGFLITYLLLREQEQTGQIDVGRFYLRRILRIWPLYFLMVIIGLVLIPAGVKLGRVPYDAPFQPQDVAAYFILFLPFVVNLKYGNHFLTPLWSVGVEEMYYLGWAPTVSIIRRYILPIMIGTVAIKAALSVWAHCFSDSPWAAEVLRMLQFESMAIGGLGAYFVFQRKQPIEGHWLFSKPFQAAILLLLGLRLVAHKSLAAAWSLYAIFFDYPAVTPLVMMLIFAWLIVNVTVNEGNILRLESRLLNYLGDISYGIYMYHALLISLVFVPFLDEYRAAPLWVTTLVLHALVMGLTLGLAALSKKYFEDRFLRLKTRFQATVQERATAASVREGKTVATSARAA